MTFLSTTRMRRWRQAFIALLLVFPAMLSQAVTLKENAPETYTVQENDTLWDIATLFLEQPWLWPELWRNNTQIANPHLIYPGDVLVIRMVDGEPVMEVQREKTRLTLAPGTVRETKQAPISVLPWSAIAPYIAKDEILPKDKYESLPYLLGNQTGNLRFVNDDLVLSRRFGRADDQYRVIRKQSMIKDLDGEELGVQVHHIADASMVEDSAEGQWLVKVNDANLEANRGDRLYSGDFTGAQDMVLEPATDQRGHVVGNLHNHNLLGKYDVVIIDLGSDDVKPGTVMGVYEKGPDIIDGDAPQYADDGNIVRSVFKDGSTITQPALKIGEIIVFKTFDKASYGMITRARELVKTGAIVANP